MIIPTPAINHRPRFPQEMLHIVDKLKTQRHRSSTRRNYYAIWKTFNEFIIKLDVKPKDWESRKVLYAAYLADKKRNSQTIKSYVCAIKAIPLENNIRVKEDTFVPHVLTKACHIHNNTVSIRLPIHKDLLGLLLKTAENHFLQCNQPYLSSLYRTLSVTAYFGLFHVGEMTCSDHCLLVRDVHSATNKQKLLFVLHSSKTHNKGSKPQFIKICSKPNHNYNPTQTKPDSFCPYAIINNYINLRPGFQNDTEQFFVFADNSTVHPRHMHLKLCYLLNLAGIDSRLYSTHSFRIGRCGDLLKMGLSVETIKQIGSWRSNAVFKYLH